MKYIKLAIAGIEKVFILAITEVKSFIKYFRWIVKNGTRGTVAIWIISVVSGIAAWVWLIARWGFYLHNYIAFNQTLWAGHDQIVIPLVLLYAIIPSYLGYIYSDRKLFYDQYTKYPENWH